jgi:hypothetical protein
VAHEQTNVSGGCATWSQWVFHIFRTAFLLWEFMAFLLFSTRFSQLYCLHRKQTVIGVLGGGIFLYKRVLSGLEFDSADFEVWVLVTREKLVSHTVLAHLRLSEAALHYADQAKMVRHARHS